MRSNPRDQEACQRVGQQFQGRRVYVAGHRGMVGKALLRALSPVGVDLITRTSAELDLRNQADAEEFFRTARPEIVLFAAGKVGGIQASASAPAEFLYDNLSMAMHAIHAAHKSGVERFVYVSSTCIYPRLAPQPIPESSLLTGELEPTNEAYALAKIAGLKLCQFYRRQYGDMFHSLVPTNLYGPGDHYHPDHAHVLPAFIRRFHEAKQQQQPAVAIWGTGRARREFLHVDDLASAVLHMASLDDPPNWVNVGSGEEVAIVELAQLVAEVVGFTGDIVMDASRPEGTPRKLADSSRLRSTGWRPRHPLRDGLRQTYQDFLRERDAVCCDQA